MELREWLAIAMFLSFIGLIFTGFPIAWVLGGLAVLFTALGIIAEQDLGIFTGVDWSAFPRQGPQTHFPLLISNLAP